MRQCVHTSGKTLETPASGLISLGLWRSRHGGAAWPPAATWKAICQMAIHFGMSSTAWRNRYTESGYRIPAPLWRSQAFDNAAQLQSQPIRADWIGWTVADLLGLQWQTQEPQRNVLAPPVRMACSHAAISGWQLSELKPGQNTELAPCICLASSEKRGPSKITVCFSITLAG